MYAGEPAPGVGAVAVILFDYCDVARTEERRHARRWRYARELIPIAHQIERADRLPEHARAGGAAAEQIARTAWGMLDDPIGCISDNRANRGPDMVGLLLYLSIARYQVRGARMVQPLNCW